LEILHSKIPDKIKVHTSTRVKAIKTSPSHVTVTSEDGSIYEGDIVVGTDGVNSAVRHCMWLDMEAKEAQLVKCESTGNCISSLFPFDSQQG
jgi:2-polyprenyl-6-methoxyphenol hydroxylase-like FAD-dependent oxidoreductase